MDEILGQARAADLLQAALRSGRLHHAYIFHGPAGVGKFTTARSFAKILLCHAPQNDLAGRVMACGECASCRLLNNQTGNSQGAGGAAADVPGNRIHPDFLVVTKELARYSDKREVRERKLTNIPVDVLETHFIQPVYRAAQLRHNKVLIIDEAELIDASGQNLLLKTLEEPPAGMYLILVTASEDKLLATIRSRCQRIAFVPLAEREIANWLSKRAVDWTPQQRQWLLDFAAGSLGRAGLALEYSLVDWAKAVLPALDRAREGHYPMGLGANVAALIDAFAERWVKEKPNASKEAANRLGAGLMWSLIAQHVRRRLAETAGATPAGELEAGEAALGPWLGVIDALAAAEGESGANVNMGLVCDHLFAVAHRALAG